MVRQVLDVGLDVQCRSNHGVRAEHSESTLQPFDGGRAAVGFRSHLVSSTAIAGPQRQVAWRHGGGTLWNGE